MRLIFFERDKNGKSLIPEAEIHHLKVLRRSFPLKIHGVCEQQLFLVSLEQNKKGIFISDMEKISDLSERKKPFFLVPLIEWSRLEWCLEKLCELEAAEIYLYTSDHSANFAFSEAYHKKAERMRRIILEACRQSGNARPPRLHAPQKLTDCLQSLQSHFLILACRARKPVKMEDFSEFAGVLIGPEGDFSDHEYSLLEKHGKTRHLGKVILRSETALIYCASLFKAAADTRESPAKDRF